MIDPNTNAEVTKDIYCHRLLNGNVYSMSFFNTIGAAGTHDTMIVVGAKQNASSIKVVMSGAGRIQFYEGITSSANGTSISSFCFNRNSSNSCTMAFFSGPTWSTNTEVIIFQDYIAGGSTPQTRVGGDAHQDSEILLRTATKYLLRLTDLSGVTNTCAINMIVCE
jgi:hypothetical protein